MFEELSLHILDIAMNSLTAKARTVQITIAEHARRDLLSIRIQDDGRGMDADTLKRVLANLTTTKRGRKKTIGLGLALLRQTAEMCDGKFRGPFHTGHGHDRHGFDEIVARGPAAVGRPECDDPGLVRRQPGGGRATPLFERHGTFPFQFQRTGEKKSRKPPRTNPERRGENEL